MRVLLFILFLIFNSACAFNPQTINLVPMISTVASDLGENKEIAIKVVDERPRQIIGHRGNAHGTAAKISVTQNVADVIREKLAEGLTLNGFRVSFSPSDSLPLMKTEIRLIEYSTSTGFWTGGVHLRSTFKSICRTQTDEYENLYRRENEQRVGVVPTAETNEKWINQVVSETLDEILRDQKMLSCLSGKTS